MAEKRKSTINSSRGDRVFTVVNYIFLTLLSLLVLYPLIYVLSSSFSSPQAVTTGKVWLYPVETTLVGYKQVFKNPNVLRGYWNSIVLTVVSLGSRVALAYALSAIPAVGMVGIWWSVPIGWALADIVGIGIYLRERKQAA